MITVFLRGGLGNQMFQYAAGLNLAKKNKTSLLVDAVFLNDRFPRKEFTYRTFDLDVFDFKPRFTKLSEVSGAFPIPGLWLAADIAYARVRASLGIQRWVQEENEKAFDPNVLESGGDVFLYGRWQSEKYFEDIKNDIRNLFKFKDPLTGEAVKIAREITSSRSVAMCVRRGDVVAFPSARAMMGDTNLGYYSRARAYIEERVKDPRYFIFTDDAPWCKANLNLPQTAMFIEKLGPKWSFHLQLVSLCKYSIIANSTFYWWGAWLNQNPEKIVIAPEQWFRGQKSDDIIPASWKRM